MSDPTIPRTRNDQLEKEFKRFHEKNPQVYAEFERRALEEKRRGHTRLSAGMLVRQIRADRRLKTESADGFKVNQNFSPYFALKFLGKHPEFKTLFKFRVKLSKEYLPRAKRAGKGNSGVVFQEEDIEIPQCR